MRIYDGSNDTKALPTKHTVEVVSSNRMVCDSNDRMTIRKKGRGCWSLFYCETGRICFENSTLNGGQIWIYPPEIPQKYIIYGKDKTVYYYLHFTGSDIVQTLSSLGIAYLTVLNGENNALSEILDNIVQSCMADDGALSKLQAEYHTLYLLSRLATGKKQPLEPNAMKQITDDMEYTFASKYDPSRYATRLNISVSRFNHLFKECIGLSPYAYYLNLRIKNAAGLLETTNYKIKEIAAMCGFEDPLYFAQVFRRIKGITPTQYRKNYKTAE